MATENNTQTNRDRALERMRGRYPDKAFDDDEALYGQINDDYDGYDKELSEYQERERILSDMFRKDPKSAQFLTNWRQGGNPVVELIRMYGKDDILDAINDPKRLEEIAKANQDFVDRVAKEAELEGQYQQNLEASLTELDRIQEENGLSDDDVNAAMAWLIGITGDAVLGKFAPETIQMAVKAVNHDADVTAAAHEGEVMGRNAKIEERLRKRGQGDGLPAMGGKNGTARTAPRHANIFSLASEAR